MGGEGEEEWEEMGYVGGEGRRGWEKTWKEGGAGWERGEKEREGPGVHGDQEEGMGGDNINVITINSLLLAVTLFDFFYHA